MWQWLNTRKDITASTKLQTEAASTVASGTQRQLVQENYRMMNSSRTSSTLRLTGTDKFVPVAVAPPTINIDSRSFGKYSTINFDSNNNSNNNNNNTTNTTKIS